MSQQLEVPSEAPVNRRTQPDQEASTANVTDSIPAGEEEPAPQATALVLGESAKKAESYMSAGKIVVLFKATGSAPQLKQTKFKLSTSATFSSVIEFLRKQLKYSKNDSLFLFINCTFQPSPDENISDLFKCFHNNGRLVVNYAVTQAWG